MSQALPNMGWLFYKDYYQNFDFLRIGALPKEAKAKESQDWFGRKNKYLFQQTVQRSYAQMLAVPKAVPLDFRTTYPGLATGLGLSHAAGSFDGESKLGLVFDHATGYPYLPASSVKGALRSAFPQAVNDKKGERLSKKPGYQRQRRQFISHLLKARGVDPKEQDARWHRYLEKHQLKADDLPGLGFVDALELDIFVGGYFQSAAEGEPPAVAYHSYYQRDLFFDAYFPQSESLLGKDYITPHRNPLHDPTPLLFFKVLPGRTLRFQFRLRGGQGLLSATEKERLFVDIIEQLGVGAKTNVGYGQLEYQKPRSEGQAKVKEVKTKAQKTTAARPTEKKQRKKGKPLPPLSKWKGGQQLRATVTDNTNKKISVQLDLSDEWIAENPPLIIVPINFPASHIYSVGQVVEVTLAGKPQKQAQGYQINLQRNIKKT